MKKTTLKTNNLKQIVIKQIQKYHLRPNKILGQHFLIDQNTIDLIAHLVLPNSTIIEIGAGTGILTEVLAIKSKKIITFEIDSQYKPILYQLRQNYPHIEIIYDNALKYNWYNSFNFNQKINNLQTISNIPYHIIEPFFHQIIKLPITDHTILTGTNTVKIIQASPLDPYFSKLTLLVQAFYDIQIITLVEKNNFYPIPRTNSALIRLTKKKQFRIRNNFHDYFFQNLFLNFNQNYPVYKTILNNYSKFNYSKEIFSFPNPSRQNEKIYLKNLTKNINYQLQDNQSPNFISKNNNFEKVLRQDGIALDKFHHPPEKLTSHDFALLSNALRKIN